jgi:protein-S-isoprenylcysteine O-methyltransferase Ste14
MDKTRYVLGVLLIVSVPPAVIFWLLIHPFVGFWRRVGSWATYISMSTVFVFEIFLLYRFRVEILGADLGTHWMIFSFGFVFYAASAWISVITKRQLKLRTFIGLQELSGAEPGDRLLQEGIYGVVRHPRYLSVIVGTAGFAMFVNYVGAYLMVLATVPALFLVTILEERELAIRFGGEYEEYRSRVPAIFPKLRQRR